MSVQGKSKDDWVAPAQSPTSATKLEEKSSVIIFQSRQPLKPGRV